MTRLLTRIRIAALLCLLPRLGSAQDVLTMNVALQEELAPRASHSYTFSAQAGDLISGQVELLGADGHIQFTDANGQPLKGPRTRSFYLDGRAGRRVGLVAPQTGRYQAHITSNSGTAAKLKLQFEQRDVHSRMHGVIVKTVDTPESPSMRELIRQVQAGNKDAVASFWRERQMKGPLVEPAGGSSQDFLVTFLWRESFPTFNVLVAWPMAAFRSDDYYMNHVGSTDVWFKTIQLRRGTRVPYSLSPNVVQPADRLFTDQLDPLNGRVFPDDPLSLVDRSSVLELPDAPDETWALRVPNKRGVVERRTFRSAQLNNERDWWVYTPPDHARATGPYPLLILFDGFVYSDAAWINAPKTLDNLIAAGRMRPTVVCFLGSPNRSGELSHAGADALGDALVAELLPQMQTTYGTSSNPADVVIGGSSAGGLAGALIALRHPKSFGNVLSQSGAFRLRRVGADEPNSISQIYVSHPRVPLRFYVEAGTYDNFPSASAPVHEIALDEGVTGANRHFRDVLLAKGYDVTYRETPGGHESLHWRSTLADALMTLLKPR